MNRGENNIIIVTEEDRELIQKMITLPDDKKILIKGIMIGLNLKDLQELTFKPA